MAYGYYLNHLISKRFDGTAWAIPSRVFARPLELYPGIPLGLADLEREIRQGNYLRVNAEPSPGEYRRLGESIELHTRGFRFSDKQESAQQVQVFFSGKRVDALIDSRSGRDLALLRLPPVLIGSYYPGSGEDRLLMQPQDIPALLRNTLLAIEDRQFFEHFGLNPLAILRALWANIQAGKTVQGGSTITQQLAKNAFLSPERSLTRKINEAFLALLLEYRLSKEAILAAYMNEIFLLQQKRIAVHGFGLASQLLFQRNVDQLEPQHIALLVAMVKGPTQYNPFNRPEAATERRNLVLRIMVEQSLIDEATYQVALQKPLGIVDQLPPVNPNPAYLDLVKRQLRLFYTEQQLSESGLNIFTGFDPQVQHNLQAGLDQGLTLFDDKTIQTAVVIADYLNGEIQALVGDRNPEFPGFNRAVLAQRPIGSLIKPLLLYSLLETSENTLATRVTDSPIEIRQSNGDIWAPRNYDRKLHGSMSLFRAFTQSYNLPFIHLGVGDGLERLSQNLNRINLLKHRTVYPSLMLGTTAMSAFEVAQMMQVIANNGYFMPLSTIRDVSDQSYRPLQKIPVEPHQLFDLATMIQVQRAMLGVSEEGTAKALSRQFPGKAIAAKTGTTNEARDSWFTGITRQRLSVVWMGLDDNQPLGLTGSSGAMRLWSSIMSRQGFDSFVLPNNRELSWQTIDALTGKLSNQRCEDAVLLPLPSNRVPSERSACR